MDTLPKHFGILIAYIIPGFIGLTGLPPFVPMVGQWLQPVDHADPGLGPPVYILIAALGVGMIVNCVRWLLIDHIHRWTGVPKAKSNFHKMGDNLDAFNYLVQNHYVFYQFYAGALVALAWSYSIWRFAETSRFLGPGTDLGTLILCAVLFIGSRDALMKYRSRLGQLLD